MRASFTEHMGNRGAGPPRDGDPRAAVPRLVGAGYPHAVAPVDPDLPEGPDGGNRWGEEPPGTVAGAAGPRRMPHLNYSQWMGSGDPDVQGARLRTGAGLR